MSLPEAANVEFYSAPVELNSAFGKCNLQTTVRAQTARITIMIICDTNTISDYLGNVEFY